MNSTEYANAVYSRLPGLAYRVHIPWLGSNYVHSETYLRFFAGSGLCIEPLGGDGDGPARVSFDGDSQEYIFSGAMVKMSAIPSGIIGIFAKSIKNGTRKQPKKYPIAIICQDRLELLWHPDVQEGLSATDEAMLAHIRATVEAMDEQSAAPDALKDAMMRFRHIRVEQLERNLVDANNAVATYIERVVEASRTANNNAEALAAAKKTEEVQEGQAQQFANYVERNKHITNTMFLDGVLSFVTQGIIMHDQTDDVDRKLPRYRVRLNLSNGVPSITLADYAVEVGQYIHPHVKSDSVPCLGNYTEIYAKVVANGELSQLVDLILEYLRNHNPSSHYAPPSAITERYADHT